MKRKIEDGYSRTNRELKREPHKPGRMWCNICDAALIFPGNRCPRCKHKDATKREKKIVVRE